MNGNGDGMSEKDARELQTLVQRRMKLHLLTLIEERARDARQLLANADELTVAASKPQVVLVRPDGKGGKVPVDQQSVQRTLAAQYMEGHGKALEHLIQYAHRLGLMTGLIGGTPQAEESKGGEESKAPALALAD